MSTGLEDANMTFQKVGKEYGYDTVTVEFIAFKEFKVQWSRGCRFIHFRLSDYLRDAPREVLEGLASTIFSRISGKEEIPYSKAMRDWALAPEFSETRRPTYRNRSRNISDTPQGNERNLLDSVDRLVAMGLIEEDANFELVWAKGDKTNKAASCSVLMRLITVSDKLDDANLPDFVIDFAIYSQYLRIVKGAEVFGITTEVFTREEERKFEKYREAEKMLDKMCLYL